MDLRAIKEFEVSQQATFPRR